MMTYREADSTEPPTKIHKVLRAKSKKKKRKSPAKRRLVGIPHEELGDNGGGSIFGGEGNGGGMVGESIEAMQEGLGKWARQRFMQHTARGMTAAGPPKRDFWNMFKDVISSNDNSRQQGQYLMGEAIRKSFKDFLDEEHIELGIEGILLPSSKNKKKKKKKGCGCSDH